MNLENLEYRLEDNVAWIVFSRPKFYNSINSQSITELHKITNEISSNKKIRAVILTGSGEKAFCAGGDVSEFSTNLENLDKPVRPMASMMHVAISRLAWLDAPVIAAVNGVAAGAGLSFVACCDLAIAVDESTFTSAYTKIGLTPDGSSTYFLSRLIGRRRVMELYLTNRVLSSKEALEWGLINDIVPKQQLMSKVGSLAKKLADGPTKAYGGIKKMLMHTSSESLESQMELETRTIAEMTYTKDCKEGITAFVEKRKALFKGE